MQPTVMNDDDHRDSDRREHRKRELISQEAAEWFARMRDPGVPLDDRRRFLRWLKQSQVHVAEYLAVAGIDGNLRQARLTAALADEVASNVVELFAQGNARPRAGGVSVRWKVAAAVVVGALAALLFVAGHTVRHEPSIETAPGEWQTVALADGSELQVGPNTRLILDFGDTRRAIALVRGEAYFKVAKEQRPFLVEADTFAVRAVGTQFAVARRRSEWIVTVAEGVVRVVPSSSSMGAGDIPLELSVPIVADQQLRIADQWPVRPSVVDVRYALAWRDRRLIFREGDTLADAVEEFNVRNRVQLRLAQVALASLPVRGSFDASDPVAFAQTIDKTSPVAVQRLDANTLLIMVE